MKEILPNRIFFRKASAGKSFIFHKIILRKSRFWSGCVCGGAKGGNKPNQIYLFHYLCFMNNFLKNIVFGILLLMGIVLSYSFHFHSSTIFSNVELVSEMNKTSNVLNEHAETHEDEQFDNTSDVYIYPGIKIQPVLNRINCLLTSPFSAIWQPPKFS